MSLGRARNWGETFIPQYTDCTNIENAFGLDNCIQAVSDIIFPRRCVPLSCRFNVLIEGRINLRADDGAFIEMIHKTRISVSAPAGKVKVKVTR